MTTVFTRIVELIGWVVFGISALLLVIAHHIDCLLYTSDAADERSSVDLGGRRIIKKEKKKKKKFF